jgi:hypothetical protein
MASVTLIINCVFLKHMSACPEIKDKGLQSKKSQPVKCVSLNLFSQVTCKDINILSCSSRMDEICMQTTRSHRNKSPEPGFTIQT